MKKDTTDPKARAVKAVFHARYDINILAQEIAKSQIKLPPIPKLKPR